MEEQPPLRELQAAGAQAERLAAEPVLGQAIGALSEAVAVLNARRQVVFANPAFLQMARAARLPVGLKPGEVFGCIHAAQAPGGCGESAACPSCGASRVFLEARDTGRSSRQDCVIAGRSGRHAVPYDLEASGVPFRLGGEDFVLLTLRDVSQLKHKAALERIFFHDILNTAASLKLYLSLLSSVSSGSEPRQTGRLLSDLQAIADALVEEIQSQKQLVSAENRTLQVTSSLISSREFAEELVAAFSRARPGGAVELAPEAESFALVSDAAILRRVLGNMLRNALEAAPAGATVTLGFGRDGSRCRFWVHNPGVIPDEVRPQIFRRYFSTKGRDRGLGTYSMKLLTEEYLRGEVSFVTDEREGTRFIAVLPLNIPPQT